LNNTLDFLVCIGSYIRRDNTTLFVIM